MIGSPLALLGLFAVAVPIVIHLLGRHQSRVKRFPTLRFISASRLVPTRRRRISDVPLLLVRCAIVAFAAIALSQPYFACAGRGLSSDSGSQVTRAIVVDTSASMGREASIGRSAVDSATSLANARQAEGESTVIQSDDLRGAIEGASAWLATRSGTRELDIISDFQASAIDAADLADVPAGVGIDLVPVPASGQVPAASRSALGVNASAGETSSVSTAWTAAGRTPPSDSAGRVTFIYRDAARDAAARATRPDKAWMASVIAHLQTDLTLREAAARARLPADARGGQLVPVVRSDSGRVAIAAGAQGDRLLLFVLDDAASLTSVALIESVSALLDANASGAELDTSRVSDATLASWERPAVASPDASARQTDARWLWIVALVLIALETWMRSRNRVALPTSVEQPESIAGERAA